MKHSAVSCAQLSGLIRIPAGQILKLSIMDEPLFFHPELQSALRNGGLFLGSDCRDRHVWPLTEKQEVCCVNFNHQWRSTGPHSDPLFLSTIGPVWFPESLEQPSRNPATIASTPSPTILRLSLPTTPLSHLSPTSKHGAMGRGVETLLGSGPHCNTYQDNTRRGKNNHSDASDGELSFQSLQRTCQQHTHTHRR